MNGKKLTDDELDQVSGGTEKVATECFYCGCIHVLNCQTGLKIIPLGLKQFYGASRYYCPYARKNFYMLQLENGGTTILNENMKII